MKVSSKPTPPVTPKSQEATKGAAAGATVATAGTTTAKAGAATAAGTAAPTAAADSGAKVTLSAKAQEFNKIKDAASKSPDVDQAKVDRIKKALKEGKFEVDYDKVAEKMVENDVAMELLH
jgi:negative regulator of flagellin synthesis FlgM